MKEGSLFGNGNRWREGKIGKGFIDIGGQVVVSWKCPQCEYIELRAEK